MKLSELPVLFFDCQTSGASPPHAHMIEIGWLYWQHDKENHVHSSLVSLPSTCELSARISKMTGISVSELADAPHKELVWEKICAEVNAPCPMVIHFSRFEKPFLSELANIKDTEIICTHEIARRVYPNLPSLSIRAISGYIGHDTGDLKRSAQHVEATCAIWIHLVMKLKQEFHIETFTELKDWLKSPPKKREKVHYPLDPQKRLTLPDRPGVYKLLNTDGRILYVGKATSLKSRVNSYFRGQKTKGSRLNELVTQVFNIEVIEVHSPLQAALVETDAIKQFNPPFNRALKHNDRVITYCDTHFRPSSQFPEASWGPFPSLAFIEHVYAIKLYLDSCTPLSHWPFAIEQSVLREGLNIYRNEFLKITAGAVHPWRQILARLWLKSIEKSRIRRIKKNEAPPPPNKDTDGDTDVDTDGDIESELNTQTEEWQPEDVARHIAGMLSSFSCQIHRSRWLSELTHCQVFWQSHADNTWKQCIVAKGVTSFDIFNRDLPLPIELEKKKIFFDVDLYDRMLILYSEIRNLLRKNYSVRLYLPNQRILNESQMRKFMYPGDFDAEN